MIFVCIKTETSKRLFIIENGYRYCGHVKYEMTFLYSNWILGFEVRPSSILLKSMPIVKAICSSSWTDSAPRTRPDIAYLLHFVKIWIRSVTGQTDWPTDFCKPNQKEFLFNLASSLTEIINNIIKKIIFFFVCTWGGFNTYIPRELAWLIARWWCFIYPWTY